MKLSKDQYENIRNWMYRNARPLDLARWKYHFESGKKENVLSALSVYQNPDGGFGHALESDSWNPDSAPLQTWCATEILYELGSFEKDLIMIKGILNYLDSEKDYKQGYWNALIPSNNDYPHAPWWTYSENAISGWGYNPTICLVGFILYYGERNSKLYEKAIQIAVKATEEYLQKESLTDMHELSCFIRFYEYMERAEENSELCRLIHLSKLRERLISDVTKVISTNTAEWGTSYVCKPSQFLNSPSSIFYPNVKEAAQYETEFIIHNLNPEGYWNVTWSWGSYPEEWPISRNWWQSNQTITNMRYLKGFEVLY
jgi:hypothetical protein